MIPSTKTLLALVRMHPRRWRLEHLHANMIVRAGGPQDVPPLLEQFLRAPEEHRVLLDPLMAHGDSSVAEQLWNRCVHAGELRDGVPEEVLHAVGYLGFEPAVDTLVSLALGEQYATSSNACLGLLSLDCRRHHNKLIDAIRGCYGRNLFPELLPALSYKLDAPELLDGIFELGRTTASTDCNGGLVLGVALFGEAGKEHFETILRDSWWEAYASATGTAYFAYLGMRVQKLSLLTLAQWAKEPGWRGPLTMPKHTTGPSHGFRMLNAMGTIHPLAGAPVFRSLPPPTESLTELLPALFDTKDPVSGDALREAASKLLGANHDAVRALYELERKLYSELTVEIALGSHPSVVPTQW